MSAWDGYARISDDPTDTRAGVDRQRDDIAEAVAKRSGALGVQHTENNTSAYKKKRVTLTDQYGNTYNAWRVMRPVWAAALQRLRSGEATRLMVWDLDRLARDPRDLEDAIEVVEHYGAEIRSATASEVDLSTETGRMNARLLVLMANKSSADTARRVKRQKQQRLSQGLPPGSRYRTFGYTRDWTVIEDEAAVVREVFARVVAGESVNAVTRDLIVREVKTVSGGPWRYQVTIRILESPIYAGLLTYKGAVTGRSNVPALVSEAEYESVSNRASKPAWNARRHLLSGILTCDECKTPMNGAGETYVCSRMQNGCGKVKIKAKWVDDLVHAWMSSMVMSDAMHAKKKGEKTSKDAPDPVQAVDDEIEAARAANLAGDLSLQDLLPLLKALRARRAIAVKDAAKAVEEAVAYKPLLDYDTGDISYQRTAVKRHITAIMVKPAVRGRNTFDVHRCYVLRADGRILPLDAINVIDFRERVPGYEKTYPLEDRMSAEEARYGRPPIES